MIAAEEMSVEPVQLDDLRRQKARLEQRLEDGYERINDAEALGRDISAWEEFWLTLLSEYESICNELLDAA
jgi:predicted  nucleic acid-binding Zn-ribbon protein